MTKAYLALQDGTVMEGESAGAQGTYIGEVVFTVGMAGAIEFLTDPAYEGQILTMAYPIIGGAGVNLEDAESNRAHVRALVVREVCDFPNNFRMQMDLDTYLKEQNVIGITGLDTRKLVKILRDSGAQNGMVTTDPDFSFEKYREQLNGYRRKVDLANVTRERQVISGVGKRVALLDLGAKNSTIAAMQELDCQITVYPAMTAAEEILNSGYDGIVIAGGAGDPREYPEVMETVRQLAQSGKPVLGINLGMQLLALAYGAAVTALPHGHRGGHPVKDMATQHTFVAQQNSGYAIDTDSVDKNAMEITYVNMSDGAVEGLAWKNIPVRAVQFYPDLSHDTKHIWQQMNAWMGGEQ